MMDYSVNLNSERLICFNNLFLDWMPNFHFPHHIKVKNPAMQIIYTHIYVNILGFFYIEIK